ncbi:hypothetical protein GGF50DRAFT_114040 [Schizophyllum commune]
MGSMTEHSAGDAASTETPDRPREVSDGKQSLHREDAQDAPSRPDKSKTRSSRQHPIRDRPHAPIIPDHRQHGVAPSREEVVASTTSCPAGRKEEPHSSVQVCDRVATLEERLAVAEGNIHDLRRYAQVKDYQVARLKDKLQSASSSCEGQRQHIQQLQFMLQSTETALRELEDRHRSETEAQHLEMKVARRFLQRSDSLSETDVKDQVVKLNEEVFQIAANIVDDILDGCGGEIAVSMSVEQVDTRTVELLVGGPVVRALGGSCVGEGAFDAALQSAVMICLNRPVSSVIRSWGFSSSSGDTKHWEAAYRRVLHQEGPNVARQWRAMTRRSLRTAEQDKPRLCADVATSLCRDLTTVLTFALGKCPGSEPQGQISVEPYRERLGYVAELAVELNESLGFGVSSADLIVFAAQTGERFDLRRMRDFWNGESTGAGDQQEIVVGTCALGLKREGISGDGDKAGVGLVLLPASVVLQSALHPDPHT